MVYKRLKYPDGGIYAQIDDFTNPIITERINTYEDLFFIKSLKEACDYNRVKNVELVIPCMFQQQHDRRFEENQSFELKLVSDFINSCNFDKVSVFHPHSDSTQMGLNNVHIIDNSEFVSKVLDDIGSKPIMLSTDGGSYKWINKLADKLDYQSEVYGASKSRDPQTHKLVQVIDRQDFDGKDILILDDLCVFGGTFLGLAKMLKERNAGKLYLAVSHITVEKPNKELSNLYEKIYCTNSKYEAYELDNLKIIKQFNI
jgi:ribose-phosphate pyrophosphokinase